MIKNNAQAEISKKYGQAGSHRPTDKSDWDQTKIKHNEN